METIYSKEYLISLIAPEIELFIEGPLSVLKLRRFHTLHLSSHFYPRTFHRRGHLWTDWNDVSSGRALKNNVRKAAVSLPQSFYKKLLLTLF